MQEVVKIEFTYKASDKKTYFPGGMPPGEREWLKAEGYLRVDSYGQKIIFNRPARVSAVATLYSGKEVTIKDCKDKILQFYNRKTINPQLVETLQNDFKQGVVGIHYDEVDGLIFERISVQLSIFDQI